MDRISDEVTKEELLKLSDAELQKLHDEVTVAYAGQEERVKVNRDFVSHRLFELLAGFCQSAKVGLGLYDNFTKSVSVDLNYQSSFEKKNKGDWKVRARIGFNKSETCTDDYDFGSDFSLSIYPTGIELNTGTMGTYSHDDKGQVSRDLLIAEIWKNEEYICAEIGKLVDLSMILTMYNLGFKQGSIESVLNQRKREKEKAEAVKKLKAAKYLAVKSIDGINERYDYEKCKWINDGQAYHYQSFEEIIKVTDKSVITKSCWGDRHIIKLAEVISGLADQRHGYALRDDKTEWGETLQN